MATRSRNHHVFAAFLVAFALVLTGRIARADSAAFFYGKPVPLDALRAFDRIVVEADNVDDDATLLHAGPEAYAYVSVGEADPARTDFTSIDRSVFLAENAAWHSHIVDLRRTEWRDYLLDKRVAPLWARGYRGLFLDTLDSYESVVKDAAGRQVQAAALAAIVRAIHQRYPMMKLLYNRGFDALAEIAPLGAGLVSESLFRTWDAKTKRYGTVSEGDRAWLLTKLREARDRYHLPVTVIDYVSPREKALARDTAKRIAELGFTPWVATPSLARIGIGSLEPVPRRILVVYDGGEARALAYNDAHRLLAPALEYLGYAVDYADARTELPQSELANRYAGVVTWFTDDVLPDPARYRAWLTAQLDAGVRVAILGQLGVPAESAFLQHIGVVPLGVLDRPFIVQRRASWVGVEAPVTPIPGAPIGWSAQGDTRPELSLSDAKGERVDPVAIGPWGGFALDPFLMRHAAEDTTRWVIDPCEFVTRALNLPTIPAPDLTTENGSRLLTAHIDGDGFVSRSELAGALAGRVVLERVLKKYPLPTTVSIIEGEISPQGLHPDLSHEAESIARAIFALPNVEIASHTYSHPFDWSGAEKDDEAQRLAIPGYHFDARREVEGSVTYIQTRLAPANKPVKVFLWSGNALPSAEAIKLTRALGLYNVNGGDTIVTADRPSLSLVAPALRPVDGALQVYAPVQNENRYTNLWHGPFYGFRRVLETFRVTDAPRRLKPISIYYHFYSGSKHASIAALDEVYSWALSQETIPLFLSEYAAAAEAFDKVTLYRSLDGAWVVDGLGALRTVRLATSGDAPDPSRSEGVVAVRDLPQGRYVSFGPNARARLVLSAAPSGPSIERANARVLRWEREGDAIRMHLRGHAPVKIVVRGTTGRCRVEGGARAVGRLKDGAWTFDFATEDTGEARLTCS